jgi:predicted ATPase
MDMCRFTGPEDVEYKKVIAALYRMTSRMSREPSKRDTSIVDKGKTQSLLQSMRFEHIDSRHLTIKKVSGNTCKWLLETSQYVDWLDEKKQPEHRGFIWIKGKVGTGKSTLMKFALANARKAMQNKILLSFLFNATGEDLEKSTTGMYRSLLVQLLEQVPICQHVLNNMRWRTTTGYPQWSIELQELFKQAIQSLKESLITCFIDALDECSEVEVRRMLSFF